MFTPAPNPPADLDPSQNIWVPVRSGTVFVEPGAGLVHSEQAPIEAPTFFLGVMDGAGVYAVDLHESSDEGDLEPVHLRKLYGRIPDEEWVVDPDKFFSKSRNCPWNGKTLKGKVKATILGGKQVFDGTQITA